MAVQNTNTSDQEVIVKVDGKTFKALSKERVVARDDASILTTAFLQYELPTNPLVQTLGQAEAIANALLASFQDPRRDIDMTWGATRPCFGRQDNSQRPGLSCHPAGMRMGQSCRQVERPERRGLNWSSKLIGGNGRYNR